VDIFFGAAIVIHLSGSSYRFDNGDYLFKRRVDASAAFSLTRDHQREMPRDARWKKM